MAWWQGGKAARESVPRQCRKFLAPGAAAVSPEWQEMPKGRQAHQQRRRERSKGLPAQSCAFGRVAVSVRHDEGRGLVGLGNPAAGAC